MEAHHETDTLVKLASGEAIDEASWSELRPFLLARLDKIAHNDFSIPQLPSPRPPATATTTITTTTVTATATTTATTNTSATTTTPEKNTTETSPPSSLPLSSPSAASEQPSSQETNKENALTGEARDAARAELPKQVDDMLLGIKKHLETFTRQPPHTIQRLAQLILRPKAHYRALASYLHAVDRVVRVSSATNTYPLPPAIFDMSKLGLNGDSARDGDAAAAHVAWSNPTTATLGTDEALGGALLTPIPWLTRRSPEDSTDGEGDGDGDGDENDDTTSTPTSTSTFTSTMTTSPAAGGAQIHSEATETIDGPNGVGSIETVSVSVNGIPSTGHHTRGITQGELLRQEQRAGVVPVSQLTLTQDSSMEENDAQELPLQGQDPHHHQQQQQQQQDQEKREKQDQQQQKEQQDNLADHTDEDEVPHARGPEKIGIEDTGLQSNTPSYMSLDGSVSVQGIDVDAALGRKQDNPEQQTALSSPAVRGDTGDGGGNDNDNENENASSASGTGSPGAKREAQQELKGEHAKKVKKDEVNIASASAPDTTTPPAGPGSDEDGSSAASAVEQKV
ncbi:hypothetical protein E4U21_004767 [Claviceps maximensis]|nr:hypothetical protein E4U21_004767 [Claviceps maximensis]